MKYSLNMIHDYLSEGNVKIQQNKYKDSQPRETVIRIKNILFNLGVSTYEKKWNRINDFSYSVTIGIVGCNLQTNGKGITREYALASGYSEMMERIQTGRLFKRNFGAIKDTKFSYSDVIDIDLKDIIHLPNSKHIFNHLLSCSKDDFVEYGKRNNLSKIQMIPFYHVTENRIDYFPFTLHEKITDTNGLAAGNTAEEAIIQGISEVFERHVAKRIFKENIILPSIDIEDFKCYEFYHIIAYLNSIGIDVQIKDCTLGGSFPVMGILLLKEDSFEYFFKLGAAPSIEIAIERCLTETFQGFSSDNFFNRFTKIRFPVHRNNNSWNTDFLTFMQDGRGNLPVNVFKSAKASSNSKKVFLTNNEYISNKVGLNHLLKIIRNNNFTLYLRDYSISGFPTYQVYIPGITEVYTWEYLLTYAREVKVCQNLLNIDHSRNIQLFSGFLENLINQTPNAKSISLNSNKILLKHIRLLIKDNAEFVHIDLRILLTLLYIKQNNVEKATTVLSKYIQLLQQDCSVDLSYHYCLLAILNDQMEGHHSNTDLASVFSPDQLEKVYADIHNPENVLKYINLPACPDCENCKIYDQCFVNDWRNIILEMSKHEKKMKIDQSSISKIFGELGINDVSVDSKRYAYES